MMPQQPVMFSQPMMRPPFGAAAVPGTQVSPQHHPLSPKHKTAMLLVVWRRGKRHSHTLHPQQPEEFSGQTGVPGLKKKIAFQD